MFQNIIRRWEPRIRKYVDRYLYRPDIIKDKDFQSIYAKVGPRNSKYTLTSMENCYSLYKAIQYIAQGNFIGDIVECGVWRGGSAMLAALTLIENNQTHRKIYLYDKDCLGPPKTQAYHGGNEMRLVSFLPGIIL